MIGHPDVKHTRFTGHDVNVVDHRRDSAMVVGIVSGEGRRAGRKRSGVG